MESLFFFFFFYSSVKASAVIEVHMVLTLMAANLRVITFQENAAAD